MFENSVETEKEEKKNYTVIRRRYPIFERMTMLKAASLVIPVAYGWRKNSCVLRDRASLFVKNEKSSCFNP
jgi:hypothetical protein